MQKLIDLPGVRDLENLSVLNNRARVDDQERAAFQSRCDNVSIAIFGVAQEDTYFFAPDAFFEDDFDPDAARAIIQQCNDNEAQYHVESLTHDREVVQYLKTLGWDLSDDYGRPLHVLAYFARLVEGFAKGIVGKSDALGEAKAEGWGQSLEADARVFAKARR
jgi:hypothetical protein